MRRWRSAEREIGGEGYARSGTLSGGEDKEGSRAARDDINTMSFTTLLSAQIAVL